MKKFSSSFILIFLSLCIVFTFTSCKGINRGEGYVFLWSKDANYVIITISDTEYIHFFMDSGIGEWVTGSGSSPITISSVYYPAKNANAYRLVRYSSDNDAEFAKLFLGFKTSENVSTESFYLHNPDREKGVVHIINEATQDVVYAPKTETLYQENISFSITSLKWKDFINHDDSTVYKSVDSSFWYSPSTNIGEWNVNGTTIPIKIELLPYGPAIRIYDISNGDVDEILCASGSLSDSNTLILDCISGDMFYKNSVESLTLIKTTK